MPLYESGRSASHTTTLAVTIYGETYLSSIVRAHFFILTASVTHQSPSLSPNRSRKHRRASLPNHQSGSLNRIQTSSRSHLRPLSTRVSVIVSRAARTLGEWGFSSCICLLALTSMFAHCSDHDASNPRSPSRSPRLSPW